jgi:SAM-dependent methyltransferase
MFSLVPMTERVEAGLKIQVIQVRDRYNSLRHALNRQSFGAFTATLERYLKKHPNISFDHPKNRARPLVYLAPAVKAWAVYMPGGFATHHVHNPEIKKLKDGKKIDFITRQLFRHSVDAIGLRSRAYAMQWVIAETAAELPRKLEWLSLACGSGQPAFDGIRNVQEDHTVNLVLADRDPEMLAFALENAEINGLANIVKTEVCDVGKKAQMDKILSTDRFHVIDVMGLFEYLEPDLASRLLTQLYEGLKPGGILVFTNMLPSHPQLSLHQRGLGWPGVIPRETKEVVEIIKKSRIPMTQVSAVQPNDQVYNVYCVHKKVVR